MLIYIKQKSRFPNPTLILSHFSPTWIIGTIIMCYFRQKNMKSHITPFFALYPTPDLTASHIALL